MKAFQLPAPRNGDTLPPLPSGLAQKLICRRHQSARPDELQVETPQGCRIKRLSLERSKTRRWRLRIGTLVAIADLAADRRVRQRYGVLKRALLAGAARSCVTRPRPAAICAANPLLLFL